MLKASYRNEKSWELPQALAVWHYYTGLPGFFLSELGAVVDVTSVWEMPVIFPESPSGICRAWHLLCRAEVLETQRLELGRNSIEQPLASIGPLFQRWLNIICALNSLNVARKLGAPCHWHLTWTYLDTLARFVGWTKGDPAGAGADCGARALKLGASKVQGNAFIMGSDMFCKDESWKIQKINKWERENRRT